MHVHLIDGTYELFRHFHAIPTIRDPSGRDVAGLVGVLGSILGMVEGGATHLGVATDHVIESFRNRLWAGYKTGDGIDPVLWAQFHPMEDALRAMGVVVWAMEEFEADDALAAAAARAAADGRVTQVIICTPDKDLSQSVVGQRVVQLDRRRRQLRDEAGVMAKFGVRPASIPDWLALVGDTADGYPGIPGWGEKSASAILAHYGSLDAIPDRGSDWAVPLRGAERLADALAASRADALLFRTLATLRLDTPVFADVEELRWRGPTAEFERVAAELGAPQLWRRATAAGQGQMP